MQNNQTGYEYEYKNEKTGSFYKHLNMQTDGELSARVYNLILGGTIFWGLAMCALLMNALPIQRIAWKLMRGGTWQMIGLWVGYFAMVLVASAMLNSGNPLVCFAGFNLIAVPVGALASITLSSLDPTIVWNAVILTGIVVLMMVVVSSIYPEIFASWGRGLGTVLLITILVEAAAALFFHVRPLFLDYAVVFIMCGYIGFDWVRANSIPRTAANAISVAAQLYLDIMNLLLRIAMILARSKNRD